SRTLLSVAARRPPRPTLVPYTTLFRSDSSALWAEVPPWEPPEGYECIVPALLVFRSGGAARISVLAYDNAIEDLPAGSTIAHGVDRKSTRLNSSHVSISYAVFCLKKKT